MKVPGLGIDAAGPQVQDTSGKSGARFNLQVSDSIVSAMRQNARSNQVAGAELTNALEDMAKREAERELKTLDVALSNTIRDVSYGSPETGTPGYFSARNEGAVNGHIAARRAIEDARDKLAANVSSPLVRERFFATAARRMETTFNQYASHALQQRQSAEQIVSKARVDNAVNDFAAGYVSDTIMNESLATATFETRETADRNGLGDPEVVEAGLTAARTEVLNAGINAALKHGDTDRAIHILERKGRLMSGTERALAQDRVMNSTVTVAAQSEADRIMLEGGTDAEMRAKARDLTDKDKSARMAKIRDNVLNRVNAHIVERKDPEQVKSAGQVAFDVILAEGGSPADMRRRGRKITDAKVRDDVMERIRAHGRDERIDDEQDRMAKARKARVQAQKEFHRITEGETDPAKQRALAQSLVGKDPDEFSITVAGETLKLVNEAISARRADEREQIKTASSAAFGSIWNDGQPLSEWAAKNPEEFQRVSGEGAIMSSLQAADRMRATGELFRGTTDGKTMRDIETLDRKKLTQLDLNSVRHKLTETEFNRVGRLKAAAEKAIEEAKTGTAIYNAAENTLQRYAPKSMKWGKANMLNSNRKLMNAIINRMNEQIVGFIDATGKRPSPQEINTMAARQFLELEVSEKLFSRPSALISPETMSQIKTEMITRSGFAAEAKNWTPEQRAKARVDIDNIPDDMKATIRADAKRGTAFPDGQVPEDVMEQAAAAVVLWDGTERVQLQRYIKLLGME